VVSHRGPIAHGVILAAGMGRRLGADRPKPLVEIAPGQTLLGRLLATLESIVGPGGVTLVVGHEADRVRAAAPGIRAVLNPRYADTNTAKSLLLALDAIEEGDVVWANADLVIDPADALRFAAQTGSRSLVRRGPVDPEAVAYTEGPAGDIARIGKGVRPAAGEAVGFNLITGADRPALADALRAAEDSAYFEDAMQACIDARSVRFRPVVASGLCREVDTPEDLAEVRRALRGGRP